MPTAFSTDRTRRWRQTELTPETLRTIENIEEFGCSIIQVAADTRGARWSYSIGNHDVCGAPEVIAVGLPEPTAHFLLNEASRRLRDGVDLSSGPHAGMVGEVECEFRPVDPKWIPQVMGWAQWYYAGESFPVLQAIYPDLENRFPGEPEFESRFAQPMLQPDVPLSGREEEFWAAAGPESSTVDWPFKDKKIAKAYLSQAVHTGREPVTYMSHDQDGDWQFLGPSMSEDLPPVVVCLHHPVDSDSSLKELADLPRGWCAERPAPARPWVRSELEEDLSD